MTGTAVQAQPAHEETSNIVDLPTLRFSAEQLQIIREQIAPDLTDSEFAYFMEVCKTRRLNPLLKQIHPIKRNVKVRGKNGQPDRWEAKLTIQTGIDSFRLIAERTRRYAGRGSQVWCGEDGAWKDVWLSSKPPAAAMVGVNKVTTVGISTTTAVAKWTEFAQTFDDGDAKGMWAKMPSSQLSKCAEAQALRAAFPEELSGLYTDDEMAQADASPMMVAATSPPPSTPAIASRQDDGPKPEEASADPQPTGNRYPDKPPCPKCKTNKWVGKFKTPRDAAKPFFCSNKDDKEGCGTVFGPSEVIQDMATTMVTPEERKALGERHSKLPVEFQWPENARAALVAEGFAVAKAKIEARQELADLYAQLPTDDRLDAQELAATLAVEPESAKAYLAALLADSKRPEADTPAVEEVDNEEAVRVLKEQEAQSAAQASLLNGDDS